MCVTIFVTVATKHLYLHTYSHADQPRSRNGTSKYVRKRGTRSSRAVDAKKYISLLASTPHFTAPIKRAYTLQTYTRCRHPKVCLRRIFFVCNTRNICAKLQSNSSKVIPLRFLERNSVTSRLEESTGLGLD